MLKEQELEEFCLERDVESAKLCNDPSCRRVAAHCSTLLDALLIFKTWFIQRQGDLDRDVGSIPSQIGLEDRRSQMGSVSESHMIRGSDDVLGLSQSAILSERDWALRRMRQMELQVSRLRSVCFALRTQLEAGLRHKAEVDQVKRELEMTQDTVSHYRNIIEEGNKLREDLRSELARVRKEASMTRSHFNVTALSRSSEDAFHRLSSRSRGSTRLCDEADTAATTILAIGHPTEGASSAASNFADTTTHLRDQLERQIRWCSALNTEAEKLRETVRILSEREEGQLQLLDAVRDDVRSAIERISRFKENEGKTPAKNPFGSVFNLRWLSTLADRLQVKVPADLPLIYSSFSKVAHSTPCAKLPDICEQHNKRKPPVTKPKGGKKVRTSPNKAIDEIMADSSSEASNYHAAASSPTSYQGAESLEQILSELPTIDDDLLKSPEIIDSPVKSDDAGSTHSNHPDPIVSEQSSTLNALSVPSLASETIQGGPLLPSFPESSKLPTTKTSVLKDAPLARQSISAAQSVDLDAIDDLAHVSCVVHSPSDITKPPTGQMLADSTSQRSTGRIGQPLSLSDSSDSDEAPPPTTVEANESSKIVPVKLNSTRNDERIPTAPKVTARGARASARISNNEAFATRVLTCPTPYAPKSEPKKSKDDKSCTDVSKMLLSFLTPTYPPEVIQWFDCITANEPEVVMEKITDSAPSVLPSVSNATPVTSSAAQFPPGSPTVSQVTIAVQNSSPKSPVRRGSSSDPADLTTLCTNFLRSRGNAPPSRVIMMKLQAESPATCVNLVCSIFLSVLTNTKPSERPKRESRFTEICSTAKDSFPIQQICDWLLSHAQQFVSPLQIASFIRCTYRLISLADREDRSLFSFARVYLVKLLRVLFSTPSPLDHFGLQSLPYVIDACVSHFPVMWSNVPPLSRSGPSQLDAAAMNSFPFVVTTIRSLLAWREAHWHQEQCTLRLGKKSNELQGVFSRLHDGGWLPEGAKDIPMSTASAILELSQWNHHLRCITLRLVDVCLQVQREDGDPLCPLTETSSNAMEAAYSLVLLLSSMAFVVGDEAVVANQEGATVQLPISPSSSGGTTHQRKRRHRQKQRHQRLGLLGWLLTGRLLPWLVKNLSSLRSQNTPNSRLLFARLLVLCIDVVTLGSHLFCLNPPNEKTNELHSTVFRCGRRLVRLLSSATAYLCPGLHFVCAVRLSAFSPQHAISLAVRSTCGHDSPRPTEISLLWSSTSLSSLLEQSLTLVAGFPRLPPELLDTYNRVCKSYLALEQR